MRTDETYHRTTSTVDEKDVSNQSRGNSVRCTATDALEDSSGEQRVI